MVFDVGVFRCDKIGSLKNPQLFIIDKRPPFALLYSDGFGVPPKPSVTRKQFYVDREDLFRFF